MNKMLKKAINTICENVDVITKLNDSVSVKLANERVTAQIELLQAMGLITHEETKELKLLLRKVYETRLFDLGHYNQYK